jgi:heme/copper-type cytochrome/quinol oxidase subunit 1
MHRLPSFVWSILKTTFLLLLSLLVLAGVFAPYKVVMPWSNLTICWNSTKMIRNELDSINKSFHGPQS